MIIISKWKDLIIRLLFFDIIVMLYVSPLSKIADEKKKQIAFRKKWPNTCFATNRVQLDTKNVEIDAWILSMIPFIAIFVYLSYVKFCSEKSDQNADFTRTGFRQKSCTLIEFPIKLTPLNRAEILNSFMVSETLILIDWMDLFFYLFTFFEEIFETLH